jgi:ElaB/YqjD/DUF883 family membrane-anchored ribosome-binding protein
MTDINQNKAKNSNEEVKAIKEDIQDILKRIGNLKGEALDVLSQESGELVSNLSNIKETLVGKGKNGLKDMYSCVEKNPIKSALYFFGAGVILSMLIKK